MMMMMTVDDDDDDEDDDDDDDDDEDYDDYDDDDGVISCDVSPVAMFITDAIFIYCEMRKTFVPRLLLEPCNPHCHVKYQNPAILTILTLFTIFFTIIIIIHPKVG